MEEGSIYFHDGEVIAESGQAKIYEMNDQLFLEIGPGHNLWALESELEDYIQQLWDKPKGNCLEIGLGLGVASNYILYCPEVTSLTTVEKNEDVINVYADVKPILEERPRQQQNFGKGKKHMVLNADGLFYAYETNRLYDFVFLDFYSIIDEDTLPAIADMAQACRKVLKSDGELIGWLDKSTPKELTSEFFEIIGK